MNIPNIYVHSLMTYPPDQGCICFMAKVTPCRSISAKALNDLPTRPGVYLFHGESDTMPLYIGKSVNIRSRVLSHLRTPDEAAMLRQSRRISWICTAGEIGALLLEARLIKEQQPLFNKRLRRNRQLCALQLNEKRVDAVIASSVPCN